MGQNSYKTLYQGGIGEIVEKKSRFIASVEKIDSQEEALAFLAEKKKQYWDASHNCYAFVVGKNQELQRCSDDGEPSGTAGRPMLDVLLGEELHNLIVVVTRYFGGTLLGTGGLVRAYQKAVQEGLRHSITIEKQLGRELNIRTDYNGIGKIQYILAQRQIPIYHTEYGVQVELTLVAPEERIQAIMDAVTEGTSGTAQLTPGSTVEFASIEGKIKIF